MTCRHENFDLYKTSLNPNVCPFSNGHPEEQNNSFLFVFIFNDFEFYRNFIVGIPPLLFNKLYCMNYRDPEYTSYLHKCVTYKER